MTRLRLDGQPMRVLRFLREHPGSSSLEITRDLYIVNVTGRVSDLRAAGYTVKSRFWGKVLIDDGCWLWSGKLAHGSVPPGLWVLHSCDNPPCVRPDHLHLGTPAMNSAEMRARGRSCSGERLSLALRGKAPRGDRHGSRTHPESVPRGEQSGSAKLTWARVAAIRERYAQGGVTQRYLAAEYGVTQGTISPILLGKTWR